MKLASIVARATGIFAETPSNRMGRYYFSRMRPVNIFNLLHYNIGGRVQSLISK